MTKNDFETPTTIRRQMTDKLPQELRDLATTILVRKVATRLKAQELESLVTRMTVSQSELAADLEEAVELQKQLDEKINRFVEENL